MKKTFLLLLMLTASLFSSQFDRLADQFNGDTVRLYNPALTTALSIIPGGGQIASRHFTRGGLFLGTEILLGSQSALRWQWYNESITSRNSAEKAFDSLNTAMNAGTLKRDSTVLISAYHESRLRAFDVEKNRIEAIHWSAWFGGVYAWNLIDGLGCSNRFDGVANPLPKRAAALSAIPFTGAGQFYNGSIFKGTMISAVELGCLFSAINFQRVMNKSESYKAELKAMPDSAFQKYVAKSEQDAWEGRYNEASRRRTMFMWYGVIFYLYGIADAGVEAHLHDFERHFRISGSVDPADGRIAFSLNGEFGRFR